MAARIPGSVQDGRRPPPHPPYGEARGGDIGILTPSNNHQELATHNFSPIYQALTQKSVEKRARSVESGVIKKIAQKISDTFHQTETAMIEGNFCDTEQLHKPSPPTAGPTYTEGEYRVGVGFNPSGSDQVDHIKRLVAGLIDYVQAYGKDPRCSAVACTELESAAMWAVKSVTKKVTVGTGQELPGRLK